ncbi:MAG: hypothetical protein QOD77_47 [Thermoplasmata archaeon]|nr:hypothetical protein [Thermoplasmata archaeon]
MRLHPAVAAVAALALASLVVGGTLYLADVDGDGLATREELGRGTSWRYPDSDGDGLGDGDEAAHQSNPARADSDDDGVGDRDERAAGTDVGRPDSDADGVPDRVELGEGTDPLAGDSDGDGLSDAQELVDCDGDGVLAAVQADDDADGRPDADEALADRCKPDADGDGVLDGAEGAAACVHRSDCDGDGLSDAQESAPFSPLRGDSLDAGLPDAVTKLFADQQAPASRDDDGDGIPDAWETGAPPVPWDGFDPEPGRPDLLVEFVRVQGPDSARMAGGQGFAPAYQRVVELFARDGGITMSWTETVVSLPSDRLAPLGLDVADPYYQAVLAKARFGAHPYVNIMVLNPHIDQSQVRHAGVGQLRGMLAAADYSDAFVLRATSTAGDTFTMRYSQEAEPGNWAAGSGDPPQIRVSGSNWGGAYAAWDGWWTHSIPVLVLPDGKVRPMTPAAEFDLPWLTHVIGHELGHNLGLCHPHEPECLAGLPPDDQGNAAASMMSYESGASLYLLPSEWRTVSDYLACPPAAPLTRLAEGASAAEVWTAKFEPENGTRACGEFATIAPDLQPIVSATRAFTPTAPLAVPAPPPASVATGTLGWAGAALVAAPIGAAAAAGWRRRKAKS